MTSSFNTEELSNTLETETETDSSKYLFDLGHLSVFHLQNPDQLVINEVSSRKGQSKMRRKICPGVSTNLLQFPAWDEPLLKASATQLTKALLHKMRKLPPVDRIATANAVPGNYVLLPDPIASLPYERSPPKPKEQTKWDDYATAFNIKNRKKSRIKYDENAKDWIKTYGPESKINDNINTWVTEEPERAERVKRSKRGGKFNKQRVSELRKKTLKRGVPHAAKPSKSQSAQFNKKKPRHKQTKIFRKKHDQDHNLSKNDRLKKLSKLEKIASQS